MKNRDILDSIGRIDASLIEEADRMPPRKRRITWLKPLVLVASLCVVVGAVTAVALSMRDKDDLPPITVGGETTTDEGVGNVQIPNPWTAHEDASFLSEMGIALTLPGDAEPTYFGSQGDLAEIQFTINGLECNLRASRKDSDISGIYGPYSEPITATVGTVSVTCRIVKSFGTLCEWTKDSTNFSLFVKNTEDTETALSIVRTLLK